MGNGKCVQINKTEGNGKLENKFVGSNIIIEFRKMFYQSLEASTKVLKMWELFPMPKLLNFDNDNKKIFLPTWSRFERFKYISFLWQTATTN